MPGSLKIIADAHIWGVASAFANLAGIESRLTVLEQKEISRSALMQADILLTRSSTKVNAQLLEGTPVRFAATATIGDDHYDKAWLDKQGIIWANAAGSSTGSVIEYMATLLLHLHQQKLISIPDTTIGIVGVGRIGSALASLCSKLGMRVLLNDPPRQRAEGDSGFVSLDALLEQSDMISLHTPLSRSGDDASFHLIDSRSLPRFAGRGIINAARGGCVDNAALLSWLDGSSARFAALDCWEFEPSPLQQLIDHPQMVIATPHIAGHSLDGKAANTLYIYRALCRYLDIEPNWNTESLLPEAPPSFLLKGAAPTWSLLYAAASHLYPLLNDHNIMKSWAALDAQQLPHTFADYRRNYPERRAWSCCPIQFEQGDTKLLQLAHALGMKVV